MFLQSSDPLTIEASKRCSTCKQVLSVEQFHKDKSTRDGFDYRCKQCAQQRFKKYEIENPIVRQTNSMVRHARSRAKKKNLPFDIDLDYIRSMVPSHCPIFGMPLEWSLRRGSEQVPLPNSPSLDRIDPSKGYVKGNVWIISYRANQIKSNASHDELKRVTEAVGQAIVNSLEF